MHCSYHNHLWSLKDYFVPDWRWVNSMKREEKKNLSFTSHAIRPRSIGKMSTTNEWRDCSASVLINWAMWGITNPSKSTTKCKAGKYCPLRKKTTYYELILKKKLSNKSLPKTLSNNEDCTTVVEWKAKCLTFRFV